MSKYRNKKIVIDNIEFDSNLESYFYQQSKHLNFELQKSFVLIPKSKSLVNNELLCDKAGKTINIIQCENLRETKYICDFYLDNGTHKLLVDTKGMRTPDFNIKLKLFRTLNPDVIVFLPSNKKQINLTIEYINGLNSIIQEKQIRT